MTRKLFTHHFSFINREFWIFNEEKGLIIDNIIEGLVTSAKTFMCRETEQDLTFEWRTKNTCFYLWYNV